MTFNILVMSEFSVSGSEYSEELQVKLVLRSWSGRVGSSLIFGKFSFYINSLFHFELK